MKRIRPKNWNEFQHYKDRNPVWIKLHHRLLDDFEFQSLPVASKALAPMLWLLASECENGDLPADTRKIAFRLRMTPDELAAAFQPLLDACFFSVIGKDGEDASGTLAEPEPDAIPEKETQVRDTSERHKGESKRRHASVPLARRDEISLPDWLPSKAWEAFCEMRQKIRAPLTTRAARLAIGELANLRAEGHDPIAVLDQSVFRSWRGFFPIGAHPKSNGTGPKGDPVGERLLAKWAREEAGKSAKHEQK